MKKFILTILILLSLFIISCDFCAVCGDGICDSSEEFMGNCHQDCNIIIPDPIDEPDCLGITDVDSCNDNSDCIWDGFIQVCIFDCIQFDNTDQTICETAFSGDICEWDDYFNLCSLISVGFDRSICFDFDGNQSACEANSEFCTWAPELNCPQWDGCQDVTGGTDHGWCDPNDSDFNQDNNCWDFDGNKTGCENAEENSGLVCEWVDDPWYSGPVGAGDLGWCNPVDSD